MHSAHVPISCCCPCMGACTACMGKHCNGAALGAAWEQPEAIVSSTQSQLLTKAQQLLFSTCTNTALMTLMPGMHVQEVREAREHSADAQPSHAIPGTLPHKHGGPHVPGALFIRVCV